MPTPANILNRLAGVVLLGGTVRSTPLSAAIDRSILELPIAPGRSLLDLWYDHAGQLARLVGHKLILRVLVDQSVYLQSERADDPMLDLQLHRDPFELRGTGGILRDATEDIADDDYVLSAGANQVVSVPVAKIVEALANLSADVGIVASEEGQPSNIILVRKGCLKNINDVGYSDLKEQVMPAIARDHLVKVHFYAQPIGMPVRSLKDYIDAIRGYHHSQRNDSRSADPFAERGVATFSIIEEGAMMHPTAQALDSVVLRGAKVGRGANVVRSVICPGAVVPDHATILDQVISDKTPRHVYGSAGKGS